MNCRRLDIVGTMTKAVLLMVLCVSCSVIDEDLSNCEQRYEVDYELRLVTNVSTEIETQLAMQGEVTLAAELRQYLSGIFTDHAHDIDLSFYDTAGDSARLQRNQHIMDASEESYTLNLPKRRYMHLAIANIAKNGVVQLVDDERCHRSAIETAAGGGNPPARTDTIAPHQTGLFTARLPMDVQEGVDQQFHVRLYMANCAAALVVDPRGHDVSKLRVYTTGFASRYNICDSSYVFAPQSPIVRTDKVSTANDSEQCYVSVNYPSREPKATRTYIETTEPFLAKDGDATLWQFRAYLTNANGQTTETLLSLRQPLRAGQLKIIKGWVTDDGAIHTEDQTVGVSVTLDWSEGVHHEIVL